ncbi:hypothetical protein HMPREF0496_2547 [Lentilactobacillus hilgardii ATCC 27305]|nr:hypothetical protein HMPREF0496_2547 [Lentilactobacillus hilgardii ATCC 27305]
MRTTMSQPWNHQANQNGQGDMTAFSFWVPNIGSSVTSLGSFFNV